MDHFASAWAKYYWANKHLDLVAKAIERSVEPNTNAVAVLGHPVQGQVGGEEQFLRAPAGLHPMLGGAFRCSILNSGLRI